MRLIELHILQSFPVSCLNRDYVGAPKTATFGGAARARISSQCLKRAIRLYAKELCPDLYGGEQSKLIVKPIADAAARNGAPVRRVLIEIEDDIAAKLEQVAPGRARRRLEFIRMAVRRALLEIEEQATSEAYRKQPDLVASAYVDPSVWEPKPARRRRRKGGSANFAWRRPNGTSEPFPVFSFSLK